MSTLCMLRSWRRSFRLNSVLLQGGFVDIREYAQAFDQVERDYEDAVAAFGIPFEVAESCSRKRRSQTAQNSPFNSKRNSSLENKHGVAEAEEAVFFLYGFIVSLQNKLAPGE